ncbi:unnamed protein product [Lymnaea stagnalis]|uniref:Chitin-binding type-2 domain-containing protein n=1 Tax=Lymnaea stagnalis TaxID=6523 RepID=A0AAV2INF1_LYMST
MNKLLGLAAFLAVTFIGATESSSTVAAPDSTCVNRPEGWVAEIGCWGSKICSNGTLVVNTCPGGTVLDRESMTCVESSANSTGCGKEAQCLGRPDGRYPDLSVGCISFYWCMNGANLGRFYCTSGLIFDREKGICNWPFDALPPCGTKEVPVKN